MMRCAHDADTRAPSTLTGTIGRLGCFGNLLNFFGHAAGLTAAFASDDYQHPAVFEGPPHRAWSNGARLGGVLIDIGRITFLREHVRER